MKEEKRYKKGHFMGIGIAIGVPMGVPLGIAMGNIGAGIAIGLPIGVGIGLAMEASMNKNPIELTEEEKNQKTRWGLIAGIVGLIFLLAGLALYFII